MKKSINGELYFVVKVKTVKMFIEKLALLIGSLCLLGFVILLTF